MLAERTGAVLKFAQIREDMSLDLEHMKSLITEKTKLVTVVSAINMVTVYMMNVVRCMHVLPRLGSSS